MWYWVCPGAIKRVWAIRDESGCGGACVCAVGLLCMPQDISTLWCNSVCYGVCQCMTEHVLSLGSLCWVMIYFVGWVCEVGHVCTLYGTCLSSVKPVCRSWGLSARLWVMYWFCGMMWGCNEIFVHVGESECGGKCQCIVGRTLDGLNLYVVIWF